MITKSSVVEIQNLVVNPKSRPTNPTLNNFHLSAIPAKINAKIFQNKEKTLFAFFCFLFCPKGFLPKNSG